VDQEVDLTVLRPQAGILAVAAALDLVFGDPQYGAHPIRFVGSSIGLSERGLRFFGCDGYGGGIALVVFVAGGSCVTVALLLEAFNELGRGFAVVVHGFVLYALLALRSLVDHGWAVERAARSRNLPEARYAISRFVARDTDHMDFGECRRAAIESMSENLTDGYVSPLFWYALGGLPGIAFFKACSTLDSVVGNKSPRYIRFGWCSARIDDALNWVPARISWLLIAVSAVLLPACSARKALRVAWDQHAVVPGPNSGWSEAATAGAIQRRLVGPIRMAGQLVTDVWLGDACDPPAGESRADVPRAIVVTCTTGLLTVGLCLLGVAAAWR
jgi:adenosylcobinamide-phosphate synthase